MYTHLRHSVKVRTRLCLHRLRRENSTVTASASVLCQCSQKTRRDQGFWHQTELNTLSYAQYKNSTWSVKNALCPMHCTTGLQYKCTPHDRNLHIIDLITNHVTDRSQIGFTAHATYSRGNVALIFLYITFLQLLPNIGKNGKKTYSFLWFYTDIQKGVN